MRLSPVLSLIMALCMVSQFPGGPRLCVHSDWVILRTEVLPEDLKQPPIVTESMAAEWSSSIGLRSPHGWVRVRTNVVPEGLKQLPVVAESMVSEWDSSIGLRSPHGWIRVRTNVVPEGLKQPPVVAESMASEWDSSIGLRSPHGWVRVRMGVVPEGLKQLPVGAESMASDLLCPLGQLWDCLAQVDMTWLLRMAWQTVWLLCMAWIALGLWRNAKRPQGQVSNRDQSHRKGPGCGERGTTTALAKKACNEKTKSSTGKKASAGPERSSASSPGTRQAAGLKPSGSPQHDTWGLPEVSSAQCAARSSPVRLEFFQEKPSPAGHFSAPQAPARFIVPPALSFPGKATDGLSLREDRLLGKGHLLRR